MPMIGRRIYPGMKRAAWGFMQSGDFPVPVAHYKFGKNTGNVLYDSGPNGLNGTIYGATWVKGWLGPGLSFDGLDDGAKVLHHASLVLTEFTIISRCKYLYTEAPESWDWIIDKGRSVNADFLFMTSPNKWTIAGEYGYTTSRAGVSGGDFSDNLFHEVAFTYKDRDIELFIDSVSVDTDTGPADMVNGTNDLWIGRQSGGYHANVVMDELIIFNERLTDAQIRQWYLGYR